MSDRDPTELYEILERFAPKLDENDISDLSRMCREYAVHVHESRRAAPVEPPVLTPMSLSVAEARLTEAGPVTCPHEYAPGVSWRIPLGVSQRRLLYCPDCGEQL